MSGLHTPRVRLRMDLDGPTPDSYELVVLTPKGQQRSIELTEDELVQLASQALEAYNLKRTRARNRGKKR